MSTQSTTRPSPATGEGLAVPTVARFQEALRLVERLVEAQTDVFVGSMQRYRERHREGSSRKLTPHEAGQVANAMAISLGDETDPLTLAERAQASDLRAYDEPDTVEVLMAAGLATAPEFVSAATRVTALLELSRDEFKDAFEDGTLETVLDEKVREFDDVPLPEARERATAALNAFAAAAGAAEGEGWSLLAQGVWQAIQQAVMQLATFRSDSASLTGSPPPTGGDDEPSYMT